MSTEHNIITLPMDQETICLVCGDTGDELVCDETAQHARFMVSEAKKWPNATDEQIEGKWSQQASLRARLRRATSKGSAG